MDKIFFSIIVPVYNVAAFIDRCLDSLCNQNFSDYEIICVDDGSTDNSGNICDLRAQENNKIKVVHQQNLGLSEARNTGIRKASGEYILFVDSDDHVSPNTLNTIYNRIIENNKTQPYDLICFGSSRGVCSEPLQREIVSLFGMDYLNIYLGNNNGIPFVQVVQRAYRRDYLLANNIRFYKGIYHEDTLFTPIACYYAQNVLVIPDILYYVEYRDGSITSTRNIKHKLDIITSANKLASFFIPRSGFNKKKIYQLITYYYKIEFADCTEDECTLLIENINWDSLRKVSRATIRTRLQYLILRTNPKIISYYKKLIR